MTHRTAVLLAILSAAWFAGAGAAHAQLRPQTGPVIVVVPPPPIVPQQPGDIGLKPSVVIPVAPSLIVTSPPPLGAVAAPDGGDSSCRCPDGQTADVEGWCWRRTDATSGYWAKTEKCQK